MDSEVRDIAPVKDLDDTDKTSITVIKTANEQALIANRSDLLQNLDKMRRLVIDFPGQSLVRTNDLFQISALIDINYQDLVLHMRNPHRFTYKRKSI